MQYMGYQGGSKRMGCGHMQMCSNQAMNMSLHLPPMLAEEKKPDGRGVDFEWSARDPEVIVKGEMKDDLRAINVTLPKLPDESTPQAALGVGIGSRRLSLFGDVSGGAARWWTQLMTEVNAVYKVWTH